MIPQSAIGDIELVEQQPGLTWAIDFERGIVVGQIDDIESVKQAVFMALNTERYNYAIYTWDYGVEFDDLIGTQPTYAYPEIERRIKEALLVDDRIESVSDFNFTRTKSDVAVAFRVSTIYGDINAERTVSI